MTGERRCSYSTPASHPVGAMLPDEAFTRGQYACKKCKADNQREVRARKLRQRPADESVTRSPPTTRANGEPPTPIGEEETAPDGTPAYTSRLLVITDLHAPRHHPQALPFLTAIAKELAPDKVVDAGDETDFAGLSFHDHDPDLPGPSDELKMVRAFMGELAALFPVMDLATSNHGSLPYRRALAAGIPQEIIKSYNEILQVPKTWRWLPHVTVQTKTGPVHIEHGEKATARLRSRHLGMSVVQGHRHPEAYVEWWDNSLRPLFAVQGGCLINNQDRGFLYNKQNQRHPVLSVAAVIDGEPYIIRLNEKKSGQWDSRVSLRCSAEL